MKKTIILIIISILVILTGCSNASEKQLNYIKNSDNYLFNKGYVVSETKSDKSIKGLKAYTSYVKSLGSKSSEITNIGIFAFNNKQNLKNFSKTFIKELDLTINQIRNNKSILFNKTKIDKKTYLYTSIYRKEKEISTVVLDIKYDTLCFVVLTGVGKTENDNSLNVIAKQLAKQSETTLIEFNKKHERNKEYLTTQEKNIYTKIKPTLEKQGFEVNINPNIIKNNFEIKITATKQDSKTKELYSLETIFTGNQGENIKSYTTRENEINKEIQKNKEIKQTKQDIKINNFRGFTYQTKVSNGDMITKYIKSKNNRILIKFDYSIFKSEANITEIDKGLTNILNQITK